MQVVRTQPSKTWWKTFEMQDVENTHTGMNTNRIQVTDSTKHFTYICQGNVLHVFVWPGEMLDTICLTQLVIPETQISRQIYYQLFLPRSMLFLKNGLRRRTKSSLKSWQNFYFLNELCRTTSFEAFVLLWQGLNIPLLDPEPLPAGLYDLGEELAKMLPCNLFPIVSGEIGKKIDLAIDAARERVPKDIRRLAFLGRHLNTERNKHVPTMKVKVGERIVSLNSLYDLPLECLIYLCFFLKERQALETIRDYVMKAVRSKLKDINSFRSFPNYGNHP